MSFDLQKILESKRSLRAKLAAKPLAEKIRLLEQLSAQAAVIKRSRLKHASKTSADSATAERQGD